MEEMLLHPGARLTRLRWRLRGAWQWPCFVVLVALDAVSLHLLPVAGHGAEPFGAVLLAGFLNLIAVGVGAPLGGRLVRRLRRDLPRVVANDYAGTALVLALGAALVGLGLAHRPAVVASQRALRAQSEVVASYVRDQGPPVYRRHLGQADTVRLDDTLFRTCVPGSDSRHALCLFVDTSQSPPGLRRDPNPMPNAGYFGSRESGRRSP